MPKEAKGARKPPGPANRSPGPIRPPAHRKPEPKAKKGRPAAGAGAEGKLLQPAPAPGKAGKPKPEPKPKPKANTGLLAREGCNGKGKGKKGRAEDCALGRASQGTRRPCCACQ